MYDGTCNNTLAHIRNVVDDALVQCVFLLKAIKSHFTGSFDNSIYHTRSFHLKCIKFAESSFHKFYMKWNLYKRNVGLLKPVIQSEMINFIQIIHSLIVSVDLFCKSSRKPLVMKLTFT